MLMKWWLGCPLFPAHTHPQCPLCGDSMDSFGDHLLCCKKSGFLQRHSAIVRHLWHMSTAAGFRAETEVAIGGNTRPADLLLPHWKGGGPLAIDVTVVHPLAPSIPLQTVKTGREALDRAEKDKDDKHGEVCTQSNIPFTPFVLSTFGALSSSSDAFFNDLGSAGWAAACGVPATATTSAEA